MDRYTLTLTHTHTHTHTHTQTHTHTHTHTHTYTHTRDALDSRDERQEADKVQDTYSGEAVLPYADVC